MGQLLVLHQLYLLFRGAGSLSGSLGGNLGGVGGGISGGSASQGGYIRISYQAYVRLLFYISALQNVVASSGVGLGVGGSQFGGNFAGGFFHQDHPNQHLPNFHQYLLNQHLQNFR
jgi:hypothetical protein